MNDNTTQILYEFNDSSLSFDDSQPIAHTVLTAEQYSAIAQQYDLPTDGGYATSKFLKIETAKHTERQADLRYMIVNKTQYLDGVDEQDIVKSQEYVVGKQLFTPKLKYMYENNVTPYVAKHMNVAGTAINLIEVYIPCDLVSDSLPDCTAIYSTAGDPLVSANRNVVLSGATGQGIIQRIAKNTMTNTYGIVGYNGWSQEAIDEPDRAIDFFVMVSIERTSGISSSDFENNPINIRLLAIADSFPQIPTAESQCRVTSMISVTESMIENGELVE